RQLPLSRRRLRPRTYPAARGATPAREGEPSAALSPRRPPTLRGLRRRRDRRAAAVQCRARLAGDQGVRAMNSAVIAHLLVLLLLPPLLLGIINKTKATFAGRQGPSVWQAYRDLRKLFGKEVALSATTTWIFVWAPVVA